MSIVVQPSKRPHDWEQATLGGDDALLAELVASDLPGSAHFELMVHINRSYRTAQHAGMPPESVKLHIERVLNPLAEVRSRLDGGEQRELDLGMLRWIRRASALSAVIGAGVTVDAGGPCWAVLVHRLLQIALEQGHEIVEMRPEPGSTEKHQTLKRHVVEVQRFDAQQETEVRQIMAAIDAGNAGTELLMRGAELCLALRGQHLFADVTDELYAHGKRQPGAIHRAIAELAREQFVADRPPHRFPGWESIITYNFDDLQGEAIDALGVPRAAWAMRGDAVAGDPNEAAKQAGQNAVYQPIWHLHGYTPRRFFFITHVKFVFSAAQYLDYYGRQSNHLISHVLDQFLAHPIKYALYIGCSFADEAMNNLLLEAARRLPGRDHYAFLKWQGKTPYANATAQELATAAAHHLTFGVRPVWFEEFDEIAAMVSSLA